MRLFISYARVDKPTCREIVRKLSIHDVWWDHRILGGQRWWAAILSKLEWCEGFIYLLSPESVNSEYCLREFEVTKQLDRYIIPVLIRSRTIIPDNLNDIQYVDLTDGLTPESVADLLNAINFAERKVVLDRPTKTLHDLPVAASNPPTVESHQQDNKVDNGSGFANGDLSRATSSPKTIIIGEPLAFNFAAALPGRASSLHTQRAYFRWVDSYLVDTAGMKPTTGDTRVVRMMALPVHALRDSLSAQQLRAWLGKLAAAGHGKQGIDQARAAVVTLADLMAEAEWLDDYRAASMARVRPPKAEEGQRPGRWLSLDEIKLLMVASREIANSPSQEMRNELVATMLCTMALRREELAVARWGDLSLQNNRVVLRVHGKGRKVATIDVPRPVLRAIDRWRKAVAPGELHPPGSAPLTRRIWKGGRISKHGLTPDGIWWVINDAAHQAGLGHVAPHDLRRSVAGALHQAGTPIDKISRLLRHSNIAVTERYLNRLPQRNEGAVLMSDVLGLEYEDWPGYDDE